MRRRKCPVCGGCVEVMELGDRKFLCTVDCVGYEFCQDCSYVNHPSRPEFLRGGMLSE